MDTKQRLLNTAETLFFKKGYEGVSVRELTEAAGVNVASVNYHFSCKKDLYREVFRRRLAQGSSLRIDAINKAAEKQPIPDISEIIHAYISVFFESLVAAEESDTESLVDLLALEMAGRGLAADILLEEAAMPIHNALKKAISKALPLLGDEDISLCITSVTAQLFHFIRAKNLIRHTIGKEYDREFVSRIVAHITRFSVRGIAGYSEGV